MTSRAMAGAEAEAPRDFSGFRDLLMARKDTLPKRLAQVASFAMDHPDDIAFDTTASIAKRAQVQPSTLVRFAQALGYQGFSDLQSIFRARLRDRVPSYDERITALRHHVDGASKAAAFFAGFTDAAERSLKSLRERIDPHRIEAAVSVLGGAETVYLIGQRRSFPVTTYMNYALGKLGVRNALVGSAAGTDPEMLAFAGPRDAAVAVSFTPYAPATLGYVRQVAERGTPLVVITDSPFSPLTAFGGICFEVVEADFEGFRPLSATMALAMTLCVAVAEARR